MIKYIMTAALIALFAVPADARPTNDLSGEFCGTHYCGSRSVEVNIQVRFKRTLPKEAIPHCSHFGCAEAYKIRKRIHDAPTQIVGRPSECPRTAYCGCATAVKVFGKPIRDLYLAANWFKFPRTQPAAGMVAVRNHHVFYIESVIDHQTVVAWDPNSGGHQTRVHTRSLAGFHVVNPHGGRYAAN